MQEKRCARCSEIKVLDAFSKNKTVPGGFAVYCKQCRKEMRAKPEEVAKASAAHRVWCAKHRDKARISHKTYRDKNKKKEYIKQQAWCNQNRDKTRAYSKKYYKQHPEGFAVRRLRRRARLVAAEGEFTETEWVAKFGSYNKCCAYCGSKKKIHKHHVKALAAGGSNWISNLVPACQACNLSIGVKYVEPCPPGSFA